MCIFTASVPRGMSYALIFSMMTQWITFSSGFHRDVAEAMDELVAPILESIFCWSSVDTITSLLAKAGEDDGESTERKALTELKAAIKGWKDANGNTLAHYAAMGPNPETLTLLLDNGAPRTARNDQGAEPVHLAACRPGPESTLQCFLNRKDVDLSVTDKQSRTALHYACMFGCGDAVVSILRCESASKRPDVNSKTAAAESAMHFAAGGTLRSLRDACGLPSVQRLHAAAALLRWGATTNDEDHHRSTPLSLALRSRNDEVAMLLVTAGASIHFGSVEPTSPGFVAATRETVEGGISSALDVSVSTKTGSWADGTGTRRGCGTGVGGLALLLRAAANAWDPPSLDEGHGEGEAGRAGMTPAAARYVSTWVRSLLLAVLVHRRDAARREAEVAAASASAAGAGDAGAADDEAASVHAAAVVQAKAMLGSAITGSASAAASATTAALPDLTSTVTPIEFMLYAAARAGSLADLLGFCDPRDATSVLHALLAEHAPSEAAAVGLDAKGRCRPSDIEGFVASVSERLRPESCRLDVIGALAEQDATGRGFQWLRGVGDIARCSDTYDASSLHDFGGWNVDAAKVVAGKAQNDAASLVQARRALGAASAQELVQVLMAAATSGNDSIVASLTPLVWDFRASGEPQGSTPEAAGIACRTTSSSKALSVIADEDKSEEGHRRVAQLLKDLEVSFTKMAGSAPTLEAGAIARAGKAEEIHAPLIARVAAQYRALQSAWREREARRLCKGVGNIRLCSPRTGCVDPVAGCAFQ